MKISIKTFRLFSMAALALVMAACSSNDDVIQQQTAQPQGKKMHFTATIEAPNSTTRTVYTPGKDTNNKDIINVAWKEGDEIALIHGGKMDVVTVGTPNADGSAPISGDITVGANDETVVLAYPAAAVYSATPIGTFPFTPNPTCWDKAHEQDGTLEFIQNNIDFRMGSGKLSVSGAPATASLKESVKMPSMISIWKLTLQDNTSAALSATAVTVKADGEIVAGAKSTTATSTYYLCMVPSFIPAGDLVIEATVGSDTYTYTKAGGVSLETGKYYQSTVTLTKQLTYPITLSAVTSDYIGSVVTTDGNVYPAKTAVPAGKTAVGILGKVTATGHGLILALQDVTSQSWNTINGWASVTTYAGTTLKQLPADKLGSLTSYTTLGSTTVSDWCVGQKSDYEAIFFNLGSAKHDSDGYTYDDYVNAYITTGVGGTAISDVCWSATEYDGSVGWAFSSYYWNRSGKTSLRSLRPVLGF